VQVFFNRFWVATGDPIVGSVLGYHLSLILATCFCISQRHLSFICVFNDLMLEVSVRFADIGRIVDHQCLNFRILEKLKLAIVTNKGSKHISSNNMWLSVPSNTKYKNRTCHPCNIIYVTKTTQVTFQETVMFGL
jgi:hypothetical protein